MERRDPRNVHGTSNVGHNSVNSRGNRNIMGSIITKSDYKSRDKAAVSKPATAADHEDPNVFSDTCNEKKEMPTSDSSIIKSDNHFQLDNLCQYDNL